MSEESDNYEKFTKKVFQELTGVPVHWGKSYRGRVSQRDIKVDVSFNYTVAGADLLFLVECKCYNQRVAVNDVEEFHSKVDDIGAHKGIMVTTVGFQDGTVKTAKGRGIALALLTKERQTGELRYVVNGANPAKHAPGDERFWQGNVRGPSEYFDKGIRFENMSQFLALLQRLW